MEIILLLTPAMGKLPPRFFGSFPLRFDPKPFIFVIWSMIGYLFAYLLLKVLPSLRSSLSKNRLRLKDHTPVFLLVRFAWLPCLVSSLWYSISQSARCFSGTAAAFQITKAYRPASLKCASNHSAKTCKTSSRHWRKNVIVSPSLIKQSFIFLLAGIHQLYQSRSENSLARPSLFPPPKPNPLSPTPLAVSLYWDRGQVGLWARAMRPAVSLVGTKLSPRFARVRPARAQKSFCSSRVLLGLRLFSLCRLLGCPLGNTPNNLLFVNLLKGCEL